MSAFKKAPGSIIAWPEAAPTQPLFNNIIKTANLADAPFANDQQAAEKLIAKRAQEAQTYFQTHAKDWDQIRKLYIKEEKVEQAMQSLLGKNPIDLLLDLGTGTGRILELFASQFKTGIGIDINNEMLRHARARLRAAQYKQLRIAPRRHYQSKIKKRLCRHHHHAPDFTFFCRTKRSLQRSSPPVKAWRKIDDCGLFRS